MASTVPPQPFSANRMRSLFLVRVCCAKLHGPKRLGYGCSFREKCKEVLPDLETVNNLRRLPGQVVNCLEVWEDFLTFFPKGTSIPKPLWSMEFGATYPYQKETPHAIGTKRLGRYRGSHGVRLSKVQKKNRFDALPS